MKQKSIHYAIACVICLVLLVVFSHTIDLVEVGTFIYALNILGLIFSLAFAMICCIATVVYAHLTYKSE